MYEIAATSIERMLIKDVCSEYREIRAELGRPNDPEKGWFGYNGSMSNQLESRLSQLKSRMAQELNKLFEIGEKQNV
jgi:hypothetical protein